MALVVLALAAPVIATMGCGGSSPPGPHSATTPPHGVAAAALPYRVLRARGGGEVAPKQFFAALEKSRAVCIGESHSNPHHHWSQLHIIERASGGERAALGMEMFQTPFQGVLDDYRRGAIDDAELRSRSGWEERWGFDYALYGPIIDMAVSRNMALLALNTPVELTKRVAKVGIAGLSEDERQRLPDMVLDDERHRAWFDAIMQGHPHGGHGGGESHGHGDGEASPEKAAGAAEETQARADNIYAAQVLWDETMAETAATWLAGGDQRQVFIIAGNGHCHDSAIVGRLERRGVESAVSIRPIIDDGKGNVAEVLAQPEVDYVFVMRPE